MPNGGSDCCGTCWFNRLNEGEPRRPDRTKRDNAFCEIRGIAISNPFWTYCANHPHHNPGRIEVPVGPVFVCDSYPYTRRAVVDCPDNETVRTNLLALLDAMPELPRAEYPSPTYFDEQVIGQLMAFREPRAVAGLHRVLSFDPMKAPDNNVFRRYRATTVGHAIEALATIAGDAALDEIERCLACGLAEASRTDPYEPKRDLLAAVRYHAVRGLQHCRSPRVESLLKMAEDDPHPEVTAFAKGIANQRQEPT